jgi:hypothetical protein
MERLSLADHEENDLIAPALEPNRVHEDPQIIWGLPILTRRRCQITGGFGLSMYLLTIIGAGESSRAGQDLQMQPSVLGEYGPGRGCGRGPCPRFDFWVKRGTVHTNGVGGP